MPTQSRPTVHLLPGHAKRLTQGYPWVYSNEIRMDAESKAISPGSVVRLVDDRGQALGCATFNPHSLIAARLLSRNAGEEIDRGFFRMRIETAAALRTRLFDAPYYRLVHAEADGLPGLVIDRFGDVLVCQLNTAGNERLAAELVGAIEDLFAPRAVVLRGDSPVRALEGRDSFVRIAAGAIDGAIEFAEGAATCLADPVEGQKTGWYFDQRDSRALVARLGGGARIIDFYAHSGAFALGAAVAGAAEAIVVDRSDAALALGAEAAKLNGVASRCRFVRAEAFAEMTRLGAAGERFDIVVADPPSFVKSRKDLGPGMRGYRKMTRLAAKLVAPGGLLFVATCSYNVDAGAFGDAVRRGLIDARRSGRILQAGGAAADHPRHPALPESAYLKSLLLQID